MRKQLLLAAAVLFNVISYAQLEKNELYTGLSFMKGIGNSSGGYEFRPSVSFSLGKHSLISLFSVFQNGKEYDNPYISGKSARVDQRGIGFSYTYLRGFKKDSKLGWFIEASASFNQVSYYNIQSGSTLSVYRQKEKQFYVTPGLFYRASSRVMVFASFGGANLLGDYGVNTFGNAINVGVRISLGKKKQNH